jgi:N6-L-threonylcarbamoyladenine synthase
MKILAIETSCDETALAILEGTGSVLKPKFKVLADALHSQIELHEQYGGVFPMMAKREHQKNLVPLLLKVLRKTKQKISNTKFLISKKNLKAKTCIPARQGSKLKALLAREPELWKEFEKHILEIPKPKVNAIVVTEGPGLEPTLWVGINFARVLGLLWNLPVYGINHMEGHFLSPLVEGKHITYPALSLLISGGHTELVLSPKPLTYKILGKTRDDAVGEAFDKVARIIGLPYPGGPAISRLADQARKELRIKNQELSFSLPRPMINSKDLDFSFSGLKTAVLYTVQKIEKITDKDKQSLAKEFEDSVTEVLIYKTKHAIELNKPKTLILAGGVSANKHIRKEIQKLSKSQKIKLLLPKQKLSTDNAIMIGVAGYLNIKSKKAKKPKKADGNLAL